MKPASVQEIKGELKTLSHAKLVELCLRLARFKKDNKELLTYLLFEAHNEEAYTAAVKEQMTEGMQSISSSVYLAKKTLRKVLNMANKHIRYTGSKQVEASLLLHFLSLMRNSGLNIRRNQVLLNMYQRQHKKASAAIATLHPDLQYDFLRELERE